MHMCLKYIMPYESHKNSLEALNKNILLDYVG